MSDKGSIGGSTGYWLTRVTRSMEQDFEIRLAPLGITRAAFAVLSAIQNDNKTTPGDLAQFLGVNGAAITRHLDRIEKLKFIERTPSASDRRSTVIAVTKEGRNAVRRGHAASKSTNKKFTVDFSEEDIQCLHACLQKMLGRSENPLPDL
ncbi:MarR family winged helix-turn-helix transcriptional regulator [Congregibacter sp.]|uniref:MarR family winged helix-turn-helix transcriptional regulator n=1 Tax=Congregibacter sp. TaxID=2744308 RepID=UPI003F6CEE5C